MAMATVMVTAMDMVTDMVMDMVMEKAKEADRKVNTILLILKRDLIIPISTLLEIIKGQIINKNINIHCHSS
jgi:hypothetical protein